MDDILGERKTSGDIKFLHHTNQTSHCRRESKAATTAKKPFLTTPTKVLYYQYIVFLQIHTPVRCGLEFRVIPLPGKSQNVKGAINE